MKKNHLVDGSFDVLGGMIYCVSIMYVSKDMIDVVPITSHLHSIS